MESIPIDTSNFDVSSYNTILNALKGSVGQHLVDDKTDVSFLRFTTKPIIILTNDIQNAVVVFRTDKGLLPMVVTDNFQYMSYESVGTMITVEGPIIDSELLNYGKVIFNANLTQVQLPNQETKIYLAMTKKYALKLLLVLNSKLIDSAFEETPLYRLCSRATPSAVEGVLSGSSAQGIRLFGDVFSLVNYIGFMITNRHPYTLKEEADPLLVLLSCFGQSRSFQEKYMDWLMAYRLRLLQNCSLYFLSRRPKNRVPKDVHLALTHLLILGIGKNTTGENWETFQQKRLQTLRVTLSATTGFNVKLSATCLSSLTSNFSLLPGLSELIFDSLLDPEILGMAAEHTRNLCQYKGATAYKFIKDLLCSERWTLAHLKHLDPKETNSFLAIVKTFEKEEVDDKYLYFTNRSLIPTQAQFPKLTTFAMAFYRVRTASVRNIQSKYRDGVFSNLADDMTVEISDSAQILDLCLLGKFTRPAIDRLNSILARLNQPEVNVDEYERRKGEIAQPPKSAEDVKAKLVLRAAQRILENQEVEQVKRFIDPVSEEESEE